jgi:hypothetical protein
VMGKWVSFLAAIKTLGPAILVLVIGLSIIYL